MAYDSTCILEDYLKLLLKIDTNLKNKSRIFTIILVWQTGRTPKVEFFYSKFDISQNVTEVFLWISRMYVKSTDESKFCSMDKEDETSYL